MSPRADRLNRETTPPIDRARAWWGERYGRGQYVVASTDAPSLKIARVLRDERLVLDVAGRRIWILTPPDRTDQRSILLQNYWSVVALLLRRYNPAAVVGIDGVRLHLGRFAPPMELRVYHGSSQSKLAIDLEAEFRVKLRPHAASANRLAVIDGPGDAHVPVLAPADLLGTLDEAEIALDIEAVSVWLRHLVLRTPDLEATLEQNPRPMIIQRLGQIADAAGNPALAEQLGRLARRYTHRLVSPATTGVGTRLEVPSALRDSPRGTGLPWIDEQRLRLDRQARDVRTAIGDALTTQPPFPKRMLLANARQAKSFDAYHSTTMEGYRIARDVADAIIRGEPLAGGPRDEKEMQAAMAVQGYSIAFDRVLEVARVATGGPVPITRALMLDLYEDLFRPSVDAGIVDPGALRGWRTSNVSLKGWRHVPPNHRKIRDLIDGLETFAASTDLDPLTRALVVHLEFVTIHPFPDGNGRLGRFLMNLALISTGLPWVTVRSDERTPFFQAIERAQIDQETMPFARFLGHLMLQAIADLSNAQGRRGRRRSSGRQARPDREG